MTSIAATPSPAGTDTGTAAQASTVALLARSRALRLQSLRVQPVLAQAYRRRAAELRLQAWAQAVPTVPALADQLTAA